MATGKPQHPTDDGESKRGTGSLKRTRISITADGILFTLTRSGHNARIRRVASNTQFFHFGRSRSLPQSAVAREAREILHDADCWVGHALKGDTQFMIDMG